MNHLLFENVCMCYLVQGSLTFYLILLQNLPIVEKKLKRKDKDSICLELGKKFMKTHSIDAENGASIVDHE